MEDDRHNMNHLWIIRTRNGYGLIVVRAASKEIALRLAASDPTGDAEDMEMELRGVVVDELLTEGPHEVVASVYG